MTISTSNPGLTRVSRRRHLVRHYLEMVAAMLAGMVVLGGIQAWLLGLLGVHLQLGPVVEALVMATYMAVGMGGWMRYRGHRWTPVLEMSAAMYVPFLILFVPFWLGALSVGGLMLWGHILMLPAMVVPMVLRPDEYSGHQTPDFAARAVPLSGP